MRLPALVAIVLVLLSAVPSMASYARNTSAEAAAPQAAPPQLYLHRMALERQAGMPLSSSRALALAAQPVASYAFIQFDGPITAERRAALAQTGVTVLEYAPDFAYLVRGSAAQLDAAARLPHVFARAPFTLADKLAPGLLRMLDRSANLSGQFQIVGWPTDRGELRQQLRGLKLDARAALSADLLQHVAQLDAVRWIEPIGQPRLLNDRARTIMGVDPVWQQRQLFGTGQIVAVTDSGLDTGVMATLSPDFTGRLVATHVLSATGDLGDNVGHGTHVAGSVAGAGVQSGANPALHQYAGSYAGVAPEAQLVIQAFEADETGAVYGLDADYYPLFAQAYADGARLHTNSWGDITGPAEDPEALYGGYPYGSQRTDQFLWDHKDSTIFFAAGNSGGDGVPMDLGFCTGGDGVVDPDSLLAPGTAKNVVTVGASENLRSSGGMSGVPWLLLSFCFAAQPIATDLISNNADGMAAFSSRGPTDDGRAKPDLVSPGTNISSNRSHYPNAGLLWGAHETNPHYVYSGGTSMATPLTAGAGALVRQWLTTRGLSNPSGAAVKATLLNTTHDIAPGQYGIGAQQEIPAARPNSVAGWGRTDIGFIAAPPPYELWVDDHASGLTTGQSIQYTHTTARKLEVIDSSQPLRVMLAWTDPPASLSAARQLVNDLDLRLVGPGGAVYYGNNTATGDRLNNVEGIVVNNPPLGFYTVEVRAHNVPIATQPYALAVGGPLNPVGQMTLSKTANPSSMVAPGDTIDYTLSLSAGNRAITTPIVLTDTLPLNVTFESASDGGQQTGPNGSIIRWDIPSLAANATITRQLRVRVKPGLDAGTQIVNSQYRAENGFDLPGVGQPVSVTVSAVTPTVTPTPSPTVSATATSTSSPTATASSTATASPTVTASPTTGATATPTPTVTPSPTATPALPYHAHLPIAPN
jgi:uncharacterized repeat protein (TIGR01451 family)